jgi:4-hydroxybenzoyl-CoA thioesterase
MAKELIRREPSAVLGRAYRAEVLVRFAHCDPAGIVFYPRYLEMFNNLVEDWCREALDISFRELHSGRGWGLPTVHLDVDFLAPCTIGEVLQASLLVRAVGNSSIRLEILFQGPDGRDRVRGKVVLVLTDVRCSRSVSLPDDLRARITKFLVAEE